MSISDCRFQIDALVEIYFTAAKEFPLVLLCQKSDFSAEENFGSLKRQGQGRFWPRAMKGG